MIDTLCAANCSSLWAITLCLAARELGLLLELAGGKCLDSAIIASFSLPRFFFSGTRSGALAKRATPMTNRKYTMLMNTDWWRCYCVGSHVYNVAVCKSYPRGHV